MPIKRVFLHLGMNKSGSTSIQNTLFHNAAILEKNGFRYLTEWDENHLTKFRSLFSLYNFAGKNRRNRHFTKKLLHVINSSECETLILSGEYSYYLWRDDTMESIKKFIKKYFYDNNIEVTILFIVRNPLTWFISHLQQRIFKDGFAINKNEDFVELSIKQYNGVLNLQKHFPSSLKIIKLEDACLDDNGLVGVFLKQIHFPEKLFNTIVFSRQNESRCAEVMEFLYFVESVEPRYPNESYPYENDKRHNLNRFVTDFVCIKDIEGVKFDLPYQNKLELWGRLQNTIRLLKENTEINYSDYSIPPPPDQEMYSEKTIQGFLEAFPKLSIILQKYFLIFFEKKYMETAQEKFKQLHFKGSIPYTIYNDKNIFIDILRLRMKMMMRKIAPGLIKKRKKQSLKKRVK